MTWHREPRSQQQQASSKQLQQSRDSQEMAHDATARMRISAASMGTGCPCASCTVMSCCRQTGARAAAAVLTIPGGQLLLQQKMQAENLLQHLLYLLLQQEAEAGRVLQHLLLQPTMYDLHLVLVQPA